MNDGSGRVLVVGVGHRDRGDDGAGPAVAARLAALAPWGVDAVAWEGDPIALLDRWAGYARVVVVDATRSGAAAGTVRDLDEHGPFRVDRATSSHGFGLAETIALGRVLGRLPGAFDLIGIEGGGFVVGAPLTPAVADAVEAVVVRLTREFA